MKFFRFDKPYDFKPSQAVTIHYAAGSVRKVTEAIAEAAKTAGVGAVEDNATEEVLVDDTPQLASVIRGPDTYVAPRPVEKTEKPSGKAKQTP